MPELAKYPQDFLNDDQKALVLQVLSHGPNGITATFFNHLLKNSNVGSEDWRKLLDNEVFEKIEDKRIGAIIRVRESVAKALTGNS